MIAQSRLFLILGLGSLAALAVIGAAVMSSTPSSSAGPDLWRLQGWEKTDFSKTAIDFADILSGGPPKDGIPAIDTPRFVDIAQAKNLANREAVIGLEINGDARAYPLRILMWHEIANDVVGNTPVAVTYCPLCNAAIVFDRRLEGKVLDFGTTGKLRHSDLVMYDRQTESWWQQFTGEGIVGTYTGRTLKTLPARLESFERFRTRYPNGKVLIPNDSGARDYGRNPYEGYDSAQAPFLYRGAMPKGINPMARVVALRMDGVPYAIALELLRAKKQVNLAGNIVLRWVPGQASALDSAHVAKGREVGNVTAQRQVGDDLRDIPYDVTFAFVFHAFHPDHEIRIK